jgi:hypothetical protein
LLMRRGDEDSTADEPKSLQRPTVSTPLSSTQHAMTPEHAW